MAQRRLTKTDRWITELSEMSREYGVAVAEVWDGARLVDSEKGKELGRSLCYICGFYTAHRPQTAHRKRRQVTQVVRDVQGFVGELNKFSMKCRVRLELGSGPMLLADAETMEPLGRLVSSDDGFSVEELGIGSF